MDSLWLDDHARVIHISKAPKARSSHERWAGSPTSDRASPPHFHHPRLIFLPSSGDHGCERPTGTHAKHALLRRSCRDVRPPHPRREISAQNIPRPPASPTHARTHTALHNAFESFATIAGAFPSRPNPSSRSGLGRQRDASHQWQENRYDERCVPRISPVEIWQHIRPDRPRSESERNLIGTIYCLYTYNMKRFLVIWLRFDWNRRNLPWATYDDDDDDMTLR